MSESTPEVLLPYQQRLLQATASNRVTVVEKSRRIGATWAIGADAVLTAAAAKSSRGSDVFYIGYNRDMTREFIDTCAMWAREFAKGAAAIEELVFKDQDEHGAERDIQAFRIVFASGFQILALCSRPRSLRGRQGYVIIDEAAFHDELEELLKAALALLIWGGRVLVISTHNGVENPFNALVEECRAGKRTYALVRTTFDDAIRDGLYARVCLTLGEPWTPEGQVSWAAEIRKDYGDAALEELDCIPRNSGGRYLARALLEARTNPSTKVLRFACDDAFVDLPEHVRIATVQDWLDAEVLPAVRELAQGGRTYLGQDFGRTGDLSVMWPLVLQPDLHRRTPFILELRNVPFRAQEQILFALCDALPQFSGGAFDARGNGQYLAEVARQRYGADCIAEVMFTVGWYREHMPFLKAALEDDTLDLPRDAEVIDDFRALEVVDGVARIVERSTSGDGGKRHGDAAIGCALALFASRTLDAGPLWSVGSGNTVSRGAFAGLPDVGSFKTKLAGWK